MTDVGMPTPRRIPKPVELIRQAVEYDSYNGIWIEGYQGVGKTTYAFKLLYELYGFDPKTVTWKDIKPYSFFRFDDLLKALEKATNRHDPFPAIVWDDVSIYGSKYLWHTGHHEVAMDLQATMALIRSATHSMIMTTPEATAVLPAVREDPGNRTEVNIFYGNARWERIAKVYRRFKPRGSKQWWRKTLTQEYFRCRMPDGVYPEYRRERDKYFVKYCKERRRAKNIFDFRRRMGLMTMLKTLKMSAPKLGLPDIYNKEIAYMEDELAEQKALQEYEAQSYDIITAVGEHSAPQPPSQIRPGEDEPSKSGGDKGEDVSPRVEEVHEAEHEGGDDHPQQKVPLGQPAKDDTPAQPLLKDGKDGHKNIEERKGE